MHVCAHSCEESKLSFVTRGVRHASSGIWLDTTQGSPEACASIKAIPRPSEIDGKRNTSEARNTSGISERTPRNRTELSRFK